MQITQFSINSARTQINLVITDAAAITSLTLFTEDTYKDYSTAVDLSSLLTGAATENIAISLGAISESYFDGIYIIEAQDPDEVRYALTSDLTRYKECILNKLVELSLCSNCLKKESASLINAQGLLNGLEDAVEQGFIEEATNIIKALDKYCSNDCVSCGKYNNADATEYSGSSGEVVTPNVLPFSFWAGINWGYNIVTVTNTSGDILTTVSFEGVATEEQVVNLDISRGLIFTITNGTSPDVVMYVGVAEDEVDLLTLIPFVITQDVYDSISVSTVNGYPEIYLNDVS